MKIKVTRTEVFTRVEVFQTKEIDSDDLDLKFEDGEDPNNESDILKALERSEKIYDLDFEYLKEKDIPQEDWEYDVIAVEDDEDD
jgi:hypothetical protein